MFSPLGLPLTGLMHEAKETKAEASKKWSQTLEVKSCLTVDWPLPLSHSRKLAGRTLTPAFI